MTGPPRLLLRGRIITPGGDRAGGVLVEDGRVRAVLPLDARVAGAEVIGEGGDRIVPGFIDLQVNGFGGRDAAEGADAIVEIARALPRHGVTGFLATAITAPPGRLAAFIASAAAAGRAAGPGAARVLGAHVEGPFLARAHAGAHDPEQMLDPTPRNLDVLLAEGAPRMVTLAPERPGALAASRRLAGLGVLVSAGHSGATLEQAGAGFAAGIRFGTHLFNAMSGFHHRHPGLAAALLGERSVPAGLIADGHHVHPAAIAIAIRAKGTAGVALTTDQTAAAGAPPGRFRIGGAEVVSDGSTVRLDGGTLAGSVATMERMVALTAALPGIGLRAAVRMATVTPARALGLESRLGRISTGRMADLALIDRDGRVRLTLVGGVIAHRA